jgi:mono/diheme cytochrome c family protein
MALKRPSGGQTELFLMNLMNLINLTNKKSNFLLVMALCLCGGIGAQAFPWNFDMWIQPSILPYEAPVVYPQLSVTTDGLRIKPLPREDFENIARSPVASTQESLANGEQVYQTFCVVCHGLEGMGDGPVIKRGFYPLNLTGPGVIARTDGYLYAYIRYGGKVMMPSYRESITSQSAWDVVNYVRKLQGSPEPPPESTEATEDSLNDNTAEESTE